TYETAVSEVDILPHENATETNRRRISYLNIRFFMQTLLNRMDRTSMHAGLEARVPFADKHLVDYVFNIPWDMKARNGVVKNVLRQSATGLLPDEILFRKKSPYPKTYNPYYEKLLSDRLREVLSDCSSPLKHLLDKTAVNAFLDNPKDYGKPWYGQLMAGPQMIAYLLQVHYWLTEYHVTIL
ncbi:MAG: asparagine synthase C-terminal domain-containing protein, partial [Lachnospira sp.]|nr:asparagine synthase C-terminal domain-containing protein [Lachnospira sp.]